MKPAIIAWTLGTFYLLMLLSSVCDYVGVK
jgi:hypothetical protein